MTIRFARTAQAAILGIALAYSGSAHATLVNSIAGGNYVYMPEVNYFGSGPQSLPGGITWTSTNANTQGGSVFGYSLGYGFLQNGDWSGFPMAGVNDSYDVYGITDSMTFSFATPVRGFGGEVNWVPSSTPVTMQAFNLAGDLIDVAIFSSSGLNLLTPEKFYGFQEETAEISSVVLSDGYVGISHLQTTGEVPLPAALPLFGTALAGLAGFGARRRKA